MNLALIGNIGNNINRKRELSKSISTIILYLTLNINYHCYIRVHNIFIFGHIFMILYSNTDFSSL